VCVCERGRLVFQHVNSLWRTSEPSEAEMLKCWLKSSKYNLWCCIQTLFLDWILCCVTIIHLIKLCSSKTLKQLYSSITMTEEMSVRVMLTQFLQFSKSTRLELRKPVCFCHLVEEQNKTPTGNISYILENHAGFSCFQNLSYCDCTIEQCWHI